MRPDRDGLSYRAMHVGIERLASGVGEWSGKEKEWVVWALATDQQPFPPV